MQVDGEEKVSNYIPSLELANHTNTPGQRELTGTVVAELL